MTKTRMGHYTGVSCPKGRVKGYSFGKGVPGGGKSEKTTRTGFARKKEATARKK